MTSNTRAGTRIFGMLHSADGKGVVRIEDRYDRRELIPADQDVAASVGDTEVSP